MISGTKSKKTKAKSSGNGNKSVISVCLGTGGIAAGGDKVFEKFKKVIKSKKTGYSHRETCLQDCKNRLQGFVCQRCSC